MLMVAEYQQIMPIGVVKSSLDQMDDILSEARHGREEGREVHVNLWPHLLRLGKMRASIITHFDEVRGELNSVVEQISEQAESHERMLSEVGQRYNPVSCYFRLNDESRVDDINGHSIQRLAISFDTWLDAVVTYARRQAQRRKTSFFNEMNRVVSLARKVYSQDPSEIRRSDTLSGMSEIPYIPVEAARDLLRGLSSDTVVIY